MADEGDSSGEEWQDAAEWHDALSDSAESGEPDAFGAAGAPVAADIRVIGAGWEQRHSDEFADHYILYRFAVQHRVRGLPVAAASPAAQWRSIHMIRERYSTAKYRHRQLCRMLDWEHGDGTGGHDGWELSWLSGGKGFPSAYHMYDMTNNNSGMLDKRCSPSPPSRAG